ncbi:ubiquitin-associated domain-containing protein 1 [Venturia canescens]|uniref:ubiquitin-associated domain-containing protein 1 n=1 Tax=Venturia canescens TaxID=32260 RepID=UPI001C9C36FF|nr:ubiquitin-associated domain-containing protein 1 [Venturia canescens]
MLPWMRDQIAEAWHSRKSSRSPGERRSGSGKNNNSDKSSNGGNSEGSGSRDETGMFLPAAASSETFSVNVISLEGGVLGVNVKPNFTVQRVKNIATKHFYGYQDTISKQSTSTSNPVSKYRLVHAAGRKQLSDEQIIGDEDIKSADELILVEIRPLANRENLTEESFRGPNQEAIDRVTAHLPLHNPPRTVPSTACPTDFQSEFRKILITLVQASARILTNSKDATKVYEVIREKLELRCKPPNDPKTVKYLVDMGFSEKKVLKALHLRKMNTSEALEWLIEHQDDPDEEDIELPPLENSEIVHNEENGIPGPSSSPGVAGGTRRKSLKEACVDLFKGPKVGAKKEPNLVKVVALLLESFRQYKKLDFKPSQRIKQSLIDMGFEEKKVVEALKVTGNDQSNACEWLLGERRPSLQDVDGGLDPEGPIYEAIMNNPHIQLSLTNPKMLLAYLSILETPSTANVWINDPEISPVLSQIFKTYHAEKHAVQMNRYESTPS